MSYIIELTNIISEKNANIKWVQKELTKITNPQIELLLGWMSADRDIVELVKIVMILVNELNVPGSQKKKEAEFLFVRVLELIGIKDNMNAYLDIFNSTVETVIWAKNGGLKRGRKIWRCKK